MIWSGLTGRRAQGSFQIQKTFFLRMDASAVKNVGD